MHINNRILIISSVECRNFEVVLQMSSTAWTVLTSFASDLLDQLLSFNKVYGERQKL